MPEQKLYVDFGIWGTLRKAAIGVVVIALMCGLAVWYVPIVNQSTRLQREIDIRKAALARQQEKQKRYQEQILAFKTNPEAAEQAAREKLGLVKPNETIYRFESESTAR